VHDAAFKSHYSLSATRFPYGCRLRARRCNCHRSGYSRRPCVARLAKAAAKRCLLDFGGRGRKALRRDAEVCHASCATVFDIRGPAGVLLSQQPCDAKRRHLWLSSVLRCARLGNVAQRRIATATTLFILLISFSRLYLGVHWFSDVLAGLSFGVAWIAIAAVLRHVGDENQTGASSLGVASFVTFVTSATGTHRHAARFRPVPLCTALANRGTLIRVVHGTHVALR
jgi:hypothetical protein